MVLTPVELLLGILLVVGLEVVLFWAASALGDAPPLGWGKIVLVSLVASAACVVVALWAGAAAAAASPSKKADRISQDLFIASPEAAPLPAVRARRARDGALRGLRPKP